MPAELDRRRRPQYNYVKAVGKGLLKIFAKMGISTLQSYRGAQIFEAVGIDELAWCTSSSPARRPRIGGVTPRRARARGAAAARVGVPARGGASEPDLDLGGEYQWRRDGERHLLNPTTIHRAAERGAPQRLRPVPRVRARRSTTRAASATRSAVCSRFKAGAAPIPIEEVEPAGEHREALLHRRDELRLDQRARRTRRWRSR